MKLCSLAILNQSFMSLQYFTKSIFAQIIKQIRNASIFCVCWWNQMLQYLLNIIMKY